MRFESFTTKHDHEVKLGDFNLLVGPNNTGKSQTLSDLHSMGSSGSNNKGVIVSDVSINGIRSSDELEEEFEIVEEENNRIRITNQGPNHLSGSQITIRDREWKDNYTEESFRKNFGQLYIDYLEASSRVEVSNEDEFFNPHKGRPNGPVQGLYYQKKRNPEEDVESELQNAFKTTFGDEIVLDDSGGENLRFKIADEFEGTIPDDLVDAFPVMEKYDQLDNEGHGYRSFVTVVLFMLLSENRILLLDEPEAFLHPAQAMDLGRWLANHAENIPGQVIISTHDPNFVSGILNENEEVNIFRLTRDGDKTVFHRLSSEVAGALENIPLLSSQRVVEAIFHKGIVICEGDDDRAVYGSICRNILKEDELLFVNTHGKSGLKKVVEPLSDAPIPVAAITDLDLIRRRNQFQQLLELFKDDGVEDVLDVRDQIADGIQDQDEEELLETITREVNKLSSELQGDKHTLSGANTRLREIQKKTKKWNSIKKKGTSGAPDELEDELEGIVNILKDDGLFLVQEGELESWFSFDSDHLTKTEEMLQKVNDETCQDGVVDFIEEVKSYILDGDRMLVTNH